MQAPDLREKKRRAAAASTAGDTPSPTKSPKSLRAKPTTAPTTPTKDVSPPKTVKTPSPRKAKAPGDAPSHAAATARQAGTATASVASDAKPTADSARSRASDLSSNVTISPLTTPGSSYVPLHRRRPASAQEAGAVGEKLASEAVGSRAEGETAREAALTHSGAQPSGSERDDGGRARRPGAAAASASPTTTSSNAGGGATPLRVYGGTPLRRGQVPPPANRTQQQPLRRQLSKAGDSLTGSTSAATRKDAAANANGSATRESRKTASLSGPQRDRVAAGGKGHRTSAGIKFDDQLEQMESVMDYVDSITQALAHRTRSLPPPDALHSFRATILPSPRRSTGGGFSSLAEEEAHHTLLTNLHEASSALLSAFSKLEYVKLSQEEALPDLERATLQSCARVLAVVEKVDRKFTTHEDADLRIAFKQRRNVVIACQEFVDSLTQTAQQIVLLRKLTGAHDFYRVREIFEELKEVMQRRVVTAGSPLSAKYQACLLTGPFFDWLEHRWLPAMRAWRKIVLEARQAAAKGDVEDALAQSQQEVLSISSLQEILRPGETLTDLHHAEIVVPITELAKTFDKKKAVMDALERAIEAPTLVGLGKAIQASQDFSRVKSRTQQLSADDEHCVQRAQQLLYDLQETEVVRRAMDSARELGGGSSLTLFQPLQHANELILRLDVAQSIPQADRVVRVGKAVMARLSSSCEDDARHPQSSSADSTSAGGTSAVPPPILAELLPPTMSPHDLCLAHVPSKVWTVEVSASYQQLCQLLADVSMRELVRRDLEKAIAAEASATPTVAGGLTTTSSMQDGSSRNTTCQEEEEDDDDDDGSESHGQRTALTATSCATSPGAAPSTKAAAAQLSTASELDELQARLQRAEELGLGGALVEQARARLTQLRTIRLKVHFDAQTRIIPIPDPAHTSFDRLYDRLFRECLEQQTLPRAASEQRLRIRYEDLDGDFITILNDEDWQMMLSERAPHGHRAGVKIDMYCDFLLLPSSPRASAGHATAAAPSHLEDSGDGGAQCQPHDRGGGAGAFARTNSTNAATGPAARGRIKPVLNNAARLRAASRQRHASPALTVENLTRAQSGYRSATSPVAGAAGPAAKGRKQLLTQPQQAHKTRQRQQPPALIQDFGEYDTGAATVDAERVPPGHVTPPAGVVKLDLEGGKRWGDDEESRFSLLELQTVASVSTVPASRVAGGGGAAPNSYGIEAGLVRRHCDANANPTNRRGAGERAATNASPPPSRFTATHCSRACPLPAPLPPVALPSPLEVRHWDDDDNGGSGNGGIFDDIRSISSDPTRIRDDRSHGAMTHDSEKENSFAGISRPHAKPSFPAPAALPPRPDPNRRTGTPNRPRVQRGIASANEEEEVEAAAARHRDASDLLEQMRQLREENQQAMRTPTPRRAWH